MGGGHRDATGLWQLRETREADENGDRLTNNVDIFAFDGETVTLRLATMHPGVWRSEDDFYRVEARWQEDMLEYLPPFADWAELAEWRGDHFEDAGSGVRRVFGRVDAAGVADYNRAILRPREPHDYTVAPTDDAGAA